MFVKCLLLVEWMLPVFFLESTLTDGFARGEFIQYSCILQHSHLLTPDPETGPQQLYNVDRKGGNDYWDAQDPMVS